MSERYECDIPGYNTLFTSGGWKLAITNYKCPIEKDGKVKISRHMTTDEAFVLLQGASCLHTYREENGTFIRTDTVMENGKVYLVRKAEWHALDLQPGAKCLIAENEDTSNSEFAVTEA